MMNAGEAFDRAMTQIQDDMGRNISIMAAERILEEASVGLPKPLKDMLVTCSNALRQNPAPAVLCRNNAARLNEQVASGDPSRWPAGMRAEHISAAADAFERAAWALRGR